MLLDLVTKISHSHCELQYRLHGYGSFLVKLLADAPGGAGAGVYDPARLGATLAAPGMPLHLAHLSSNWSGTLSCF